MISDDADDSRSAVGGCAVLRRCSAGWPGAVLVPGVWPWLPRERTGGVGVSVRDAAAVRAALLDRDAAYARLDDVSDQLAAAELEVRELRAQLDELRKAR